MYRSELFVPYVPRDNTHPHPSAVCEPINLACAQPPDVTYVPVDALHALSSMQRETIAMIMDAFARGNNFLLGDATGVGKGRTIAGVIGEMVAREAAPRLLWVSANTRLTKDAAVEVCRVGATDDGHRNGAVKYTTYAALLRQHTVDELRTWLAGGSKGLVVLDECHLLRNAKLSYHAVHRLVDGGVHVLYSSATAASLPQHLHYLQGLALWGEGTAFPRYEQFAEAMRKHGTHLMELLAIQMRAAGVYVSRQLSLHDVTVEHRTIRLSPAEARVYDEVAVAARAANIHSGTAHQSLFQNLITALKTPHAIRVAEAELAVGRSVVLSLVGTGEAEAKRAMKRPRGGGLPRACAKYLDEHLMASDLPVNPIDQLIAHFGPEHVAELTGRSKRPIRTDDGIVWSPRPALHEEVEHFRAGRKRIAVVSRAGGVGISLDDGDDGRPRTHVVLELPWSAEDLMQQLGRVHRATSTAPPLYIILSSDVPAEARFASSVVSKLASLGALTKADHRSCAPTLRVPKWTTADRRSIALYFAVARAYDPSRPEAIPVVTRTQALMVAHANSRSEIAAKLHLTRALNIEDGYERAPLLAAAHCLFPAESVPYTQGWNAVTHGKFPAPFRARVRTLLLCHRSAEAQHTLGLLSADLLECIVTWMATPAPRGRCHETAFRLQEHGLADLSAMPLDGIFNRLLGMELRHQQAVFGVGDFMCDPKPAQQIGCLMRVVGARAGPELHASIRAIDYMDFGPHGSGLRIGIEYEARELTAPPSGAQVWQHIKQPGRVAWSAGSEVHFADGTTLRTESPALQAMPHRGFFKTSSDTWHATVARRLRLANMRISGLPACACVVTRNAMACWDRSLKRIVRVPPWGPFRHGAIGLLMRFEQVQVTRARQVHIAD